ncbi:MAG: hypothetical protein IIB68_11830 [Proteobacteria bacterium]|nr:hypothetical protein [Pseudomonadota bacterium]
MQIRNVQSAGAGLLSALFAASCCLIPLGLIAVGLGSVGWMMTMMSYQWLTIPGGILFLVLAYYSYFLERRRCTQAGCRFVGQHFTMGILIFATGIVSLALGAILFPSLINGLLHVI